MKNGIIRSVLENNTVVDYLKKMGHEPARQTGGRYKYSCPIHGPENDPSFYVFSTKEFQHYHCFGCGAHGDVINLVSALEGLTTKSAIGTLVGDFKAVPEEAIEQAVGEIDDNKDKDTLDIGLRMISLSATFYTYLEIVNFDPNEVEFMEKVFSLVDKIIIAMDEDQFKLADETIRSSLIARADQYAVKREKQIEKDYRLQSNAS